MSEDSARSLVSPRISVVIAARNASRFLEPVLDSLRRNGGADVEALIVDDCSDDDTPARAARLGARVVRLPAPVGAAAARNVGAKEAAGEVVMFTDHDCCMCDDTLARVRDALPRLRGTMVLGGTYSTDPYDAHRFASCFQSLHVHYSETRRMQPDYLASHCFIMNRALFLREGGFPESLSLILPNGCCQDVLFSHALRRHGFTLEIDPRIQVRHIFNFTVPHSVFNAFWKSRAWTRVALSEGSLLRDSGSASTEMKASAGLLAAALASLLCLPWIRWMVVPAAVLASGSIAASGRFYRFVYAHKGARFTLGAIGLYSLHLVAVLAGGFVGAVQGPLRPRR